MVARLDTLLQGRTSLYRACRRRPTDLLSSTPSWITMADFVRDIVTRDTPPGGPPPPSLAQTSPVPARTDGPESASSPSLQASCEASSSQTTAGREEGKEAGRRGGRECPGKKRVGGSEAGGEEEKSWEGAGVNSRRSKRIARGGDEDGNRIGGNGDGGSWERGWEGKNVVGGEAPALEEAREVGKEGGEEVWVGGSLGGPGEGGQEGGTQVSESRTAWSEGEAEEEGRKESKEGRVKDTAEQGRVGKEGSVSDRCFSSRGKALPFRLAGAEGSDLAAGQVSEQREERVDTEASRDLGGIGRDVQGKGHQNRDDKGEGRERGGEVQVFDEAEAVDGLDTAGLSTGDMICPTKIVSCEEERAGAPEDSEGGTPSQ
ncbi:hypothetical protein Naga_100153g5 [Nannochloropsis gaditana]|uniref:Uncharacterized protein n=1 Tax=Nannochloropsis gaditana TaxID=72520 RepID=W7T6Q5_9STRA|nr:hypothetical protein Naga_100153g5 [Nannochloropsis gaditana]